MCNDRYRLSLLSVCPPYGSQHMQSHQAYEIQVSNLTRSVATLEENLRVTEDDKQELLSDMSAARELCSHLETSKESLNRQLAAAELDKEQVR